MKMKAIATLLMTALIVTACAEGKEKETGGTVIGGIAGAVIGAQFGSGSGQIIAAAAGTLAGAFIGNRLGASLDKKDQAAMVKAEEQAHATPVGETITWNNPDSGNSGSVTPTREGTNTSGQTCREYEQTVTTDGKEQKAKGKSCRQADGSWKTTG